MSWSVKQSAKAVLAALKWQRSALKNVGKSVPIYPPIVPKGLKVHLGAGEINLQGWINVDARPFEHIHAISNSLELTQFTDGAVSTIYMSHVLEHLAFEEAKALLLALHKKLADGGCIMIAVPDFDALIKIYLASGNDLDSIKYPLMGGQGYEHNFHKSVYTLRALATLLNDCGYRDVSPWEPEREFGCDIGDWSSAIVKTSGSEVVSLSLNVKAAKVGSTRDLSSN